MNKISSFCDRFIEAGWLAALVIAPLFINFHSSVSFEPDKSAMIRSIALIMLSAFIIRRTDLSGLKPVLKQPLFIITLLLGLSYLVSALLSVLSSGSWWGSYARGQGAYSLLGYFIIFGTAALTLKNRAQVERILITVILTSIPVMLYGFAQKLKLEALSWDADFSIRIASTLGNPIFFGSYLIMVIPLTSYLLIRCLKESALFSPKFVFYSVILLAQVFCLILTESRGPLLGLITAGFFFTVLSGLVFRKRFLALGSYIMAGLVIGFFMLLAMPNTPFQGLKSRMGRLGQMFEAREGAATVRLLIWQGVVNMVRSDYYRAAVGYGPETMFVPYHKYCPAELITSENKITFPDRSHNEFFDTVITNGLAGALIYLILFGAVIFYAFRILNLPGRPAVLIALLLLFGLAGLLIPIVAGRAIYIALGVPLGLVVGAEFYLFHLALSGLGFRNPGPNSGPNSNAPHYALLIIALFSALIGHFVETQFGIDLTASRVYFYIYLAVLVGLIARRIEPPSKSAPENSPQNQVTAGWNSVPVGALITALVLTTMAFNFIPTQITGENSDRAMRVLAMITAVWLISGALFYLIGRFALLVSLLSVGLTAVFFAVLISVLPPLYSPTVAVTVFYGWVLLVIFWLAWALPVASAEAIPAQAELQKDGEKKHKLSGASSQAWVFFSVLIAIGAFITIILTCLNPIKGDIIYKIGSGQERSKNWEIALNYYRQALALSPDKGSYYGALARMCLEKYYAEKNPARKKEWYGRCLDYLSQSIRYDPMNPTRNANLGRFYRVQGRESDDSARRSENFSLALKYYRAACELSPQHPALRNEFGEVYHEMGKLDEAIRQYEKSLTISPDFSETYSHLGDAYLQSNDTGRAFENYLQAVKIQYRILPDLRDQNQEMMFERANRTIINRYPQDFRPYVNLGRYYALKGRRAKAIEALDKALVLADLPESQADEPAKSDIKRMIERLKPIK